MKVPISDYSCISLDAPVLPAMQVCSQRSGAILWRVWCKFCRKWHYHGPGEGHREAHCSGETRYTATGYNLARKR